MSDKTPPTFAELRAMFREIAAEFREVKALFKDTDAKIKELTASAKETDRLVKAASKDIGGLSEKWGDLGEAMTIGEIMPLLNTVDAINVSALYLKHETNNEGQMRELDGMVVGDDMVVVIEAKASLRKGHVETFINKKCSNASLNFCPYSLTEKSTVQSATSVPAAKQRTLPTNKDCCLSALCKATKSS